MFRYCNNHEQKYLYDDGEMPDGSCPRCAKDEVIIKGLTSPETEELFQLDLVKHPLFNPLMKAIVQAADGKGRRHGGNTVPFMEQQWVALATHHGIGFLTGQAAKKLNEAAARYNKGGDTKAFEREVLGAIVYAGMALLHAAKGDE